MKWEIDNRYFKRYAIPAFVFYISTYIIAGVVYEDFAQVVLKHSAILGYSSSAFFIYYGLYLWFIQRKDSKEPPNECWYKDIK